jgi:pseudaminic acid synthase
MMNNVRIGNLKIGLGHRPFIIAEMSGNHNQSLERALEITEAAAKAGAHALKLQTYTPEALTLNLKSPEFIIDHEESIWRGKSLYELYKIAHTPWDWHKKIIKRANELGMICFSTPSDEAAVDFLEKLKVPAYKIASFENAHLPLIRRVAATNKPIMISTGMAGLTELGQTVNTLREAGCDNYILLKCTSAYPANPIESNVLTIPHMRKLFRCEVGLSDHTMGIGAAVAAVAQGATVIEKHFTLRRSDGGVDAAFSSEPGEMKALVLETERAWQSLGKVHYGPTNSEKPSIQERRSLYIVRDMKAGDVITKENMRCIRPGFGLPPKHYDVLLGLKVSRNIKKGTPLNWRFIVKKHE